MNPEHTSYENNDVERINSLDDLNNNLRESALANAQNFNAVPKRPSYHFKMIKTDTHGEPTKWIYAKWGAIALILGISVMSFLTQSFLVAKDVVFNRPEGQSVSGYVFAYIKGDMSDASKNNTNIDEVDGKNVVNEDRSLGSDDAEVGGYEPGEINANNGNAGSQYRLQNAVSFPRLTAKSFLAADLKTGEIILEQNEDLIAPMASVSKLMTGLIAEEKMDLQKIAIVSRDSYNTYGAQGSLKLGEKIRLYDLMYPLLMESSNDAAEVIADAYGNPEFLAEMNKKAAELGMKDTYYEDPSGLNPKNVSSVHDLLKLARYIHTNKPVIYDMTRVKNYAILKHQWNNLNRFLTYDSFLGGKNGYIDEARKTTVSLFEIPLAKGGKRSIVIVLLKSDDREGDALKIINFLKKNAIFAERV